MSLRQTQKELEVVKRDKVMLNTTLRKAAHEVDELRQVTTSLALAEKGPSAELEQTLAAQLACKEQELIDAENELRALNDRLEEIEVQEEKKVRVKPSRALSQEDTVDPDSLFSNNRAWIFAESIHNFPFSDSIM